MRAVLAALPFLISKMVEEEIYRVYVTDCLKAVSENTAKNVEGSYMTKRYYDLVHSKNHQENKTGEEIAASVIKDCGLKVVK